MADPIIDGIHSSPALLHQSLVDAAGAYLERLHLAPCTNETPILFYRMDFHGIGNDLTRATAALAAAVIKRRQLVLLPPLRRLHAKVPSLRHTNWQRPWHWLASARVPNDDLLVTSDCQRHMSATRPDLMRLLANATEVDTGATLRRFGEYALHNTSMAYRTSWRVGMDSNSIPLAFRRQGLLWWFQVLTNFWIRARGDLKERLMRHEALKTLRRKLRFFPHSYPRGVPPPAIAEPIGRTLCGGRRRRPCDKLGSGWLPEVWFDVGLHIRMGDACGANAPERGQRSRRCSARPLQDAFALMNAHQLRGHVFLATDSAEIARASEAIGAEHGFKVSTLQIDRKQHDSLCLSTASRKDEPRCGTEFVDRTRERDLDMLTDTLLDSLLLSRSTVLVGAMMSNFPRLALQLRVQMPIGEPVQMHRYIALDGRKWCTRSSCRMNYTDTFGTA